MSTITILKDGVKNKELIAVSRDAYEEFLAWKRKVKLAGTFQPTATVRKALLRARKNRLKGNVFTIDDLRKKLGFRN